MTQVLLIHAGPTPWDVENRLTGAHSLPLTPDAAAAAQSLVDAIAAPVGVVCHSKANEACAQLANMLAIRFGLRLRDKPELNEIRLGLWEGLTRDELARPCPTVFARWEQSP